MPHEEETMDARTAMILMQGIVSRELSDLNRDKRDLDDVIECKNKQILIQRKDAERQRLDMQAKIDCLETDKKFANTRVAHSSMVARESIFYALHSLHDRFYLNRLRGLCELIG